MKYYSKTATGAYQQVTDQEKIKRWLAIKPENRPNYQGQRLYLIPELLELKEAAKSIIGNCKTNRLTAKKSIIDKIDQANSVKELYDELITAYKHIQLTAYKRDIPRYKAEGNVLAQAIRLICLKHMHIILYDKLDRRGDVVAQPTLPGLSTILFDGERSHDIVKESGNGHDLHKKRF